MRNALIPAFMVSVFAVSPAGYAEVNKPAIARCLRQTSGALDSQSRCMDVSGAASVCDPRDQFVLMRKIGVIGLGIRVEKLSCSL